MSNEPDIGYFEKQKNLIVIAQKYAGSSVCEIGFNAGFSALLFLLTNPSIKVSCFDLGEHTYTKPAFEQLKEDFGERISLVLGDSQQTMKTVHNTFDFVHVDGGHIEAVAKSDCQEALRILNPKGFLLVDDTNLGAVSAAIKTIQNRIQQVDLPFPTTYHSFYQKTT
jgi:predicted O-methyltransferase YrrM